MKIVNRIEELGREMKSFYNDGFTAQHYKNQLLEIQTAVSKALENAPIFSNEKDINNNVTQR
jgi:hypothetical protein